jgi:hypothetical protein
MTKKLTVFHLLSFNKLNYAGEVRIALTYACYS